MLWGCELAKDALHDGGCSHYFLILNRERQIVFNGLIKLLDQVSHSCFHVKVSSKKLVYVGHKVPQILSCQVERRNELLGKTRISIPSQFDQSLLVLIQHQ